MNIKTAEIISDISHAGYISVRKYVIDQVVRSGSTPKRLASMRALATRFGVGSSTVQRALKDLVDDGYLTAKKGIGMFTNPEFSWRGRKQEIIEVLIADGRQIYFEKYLASLLSAVAPGLTDEGRMIHFIDFFNFNRETFSGPDAASRALIWLYPDLCEHKRAIDFVNSIRIPVIFAGGFSTEHHCARYNWEEEGYTAALALLKEGRKKIMLLTDPQHEPLHLAGVKRAFHEMGETYDESLVLRGNQNLVADCERLMKRKGIPEAFYEGANGFGALEAVFQDWGVDFLRQCRLVSQDDSCHLFPVPQWRFRHNYSKMGEEVLALLKLALQNPQGPPELRLVPRELDTDLHP